MGWGGFEDPAEAKAAAEAAEAMNRRAAESDARTEALATAIVEGFGLVAQAILAAAGMSSGMGGPPDETLVRLSDGALVGSRTEDEREDLAALLDGGDDIPK